MLSEKTKKYYSLTVNKAHGLKIYPFSFKNGCVNIDESNLCMKFISIFSLLINVGAFVYFGFIRLFLCTNVQVTVLIMLEVCAGFAIAFCCIICSFSVTSLES